MSQTQVERLFIKDKTSLMHDTWRLTSNIAATSSAFTTIAANLERSDDALAGQVGTGMSESSGIFTFPSTGIYKITANFQYLRNNAAIRYCGGYIMSTSNNFTSEDALTGNFASLNDVASHYQNVTMSCVYDVTDLSNNKCKFLYQCSDGFTLASDSNSNYTYFTFQRLGDT
jgi:hypothetical protein